MKGRALTLPQPTLSLEQILLLPDTRIVCTAVLPQGPNPSLLDLRSTSDFWRPSQVRCLHNSFMRLSCCAQVNMLGATTYSPLQICYVTPRRLESLDPTRVHTVGCSMAVSDGSSGSLQECLRYSLHHQAMALWNICSSKNRFHSSLWVVLCLECSFFISSRNSWDWRAQSATHLGQPVLWTYFFACFPRMVKLSWYKVINFSIL